MQDESPCCMPQLSHTVPVSTVEEGLIPISPSPSVKVKVIVSEKPLIVLEDDTDWNVILGITE